MTRNQCSVFYYKIFIFIVIVQKVVYGTPYTVRETCHGYLERRVKMKMAASCITVRHMGQHRICVTRKLDEPNKLDSQEEEKKAA